MKTFLDLLATKNSIGLLLHLRPITDNGSPRCTVKINNTVLYQDNLDQPVVLNTAVGLLEPISVSIAMSNKIYSSERETAIVIENFEIDGHAVVPKWTSLANYTNDHGHNTAGNYLGFNGVWSINIDQPFYTWYHTVTGQGWLLQPG